MIDEMPFCLCHQVFGYKKTKPKLLYNKNRNLYIMCCASCGFTSITNSNKQAVIANWRGSNKPNDNHIQECWMRFRKEHPKNSEIGTVVPEVIK